MTQLKEQITDAEVLDVSTSYQFSTGQLLLVIGNEKDSREYVCHFLGYFSVDLETSDGQLYELRKTGQLVSCTCRDYIYRRGPYGVRCKHGVACILAGLLR